MYRTYFFSLLFLILGFYLTAQENSTENLIHQGVTAHRSGDYDQALAYYNLALEKDPSSYSAHYEISMTLMQMQEFEKVIAHSNIILGNENDLHVHAYIAKASALDYLTHTEEAIDVMKEAIREEGDNYLIHYNLSYYYFSLLNHKSARFHAMEAIRDNNAHASSHLLLASIEVDAGNRVASLMPFYYYLLLEPTSVRSEDAFESLVNQLNSKNSIEDIDDDDPYVVMERYLSLRDEEKDTKLGPEFDKDKFIELSSSIFSMLNQVELTEKDIYSEMYKPFFSSLAKSPHIFTYGNYITQIVSKRAYTWSLDNKDKLDAMNSWLTSHYDKWKYK